MNALQKLFTGKLKLRNLFTRKVRVYGVWLEVRHNNKCIHKCPVRVACKYKFQAKARAFKEITLVIGDIKKTRSSR